MALPYKTFADADKTEILPAFEAAYRTLFGRVIEGLGIEITNWSLVVASVLPETPPVARHGCGAGVTARRKRQFYDAALRKSVEAREVDRAEMAAGCAVDGPAIIVENETTTIVTSGYRCVGQGDGSLRLIRKGDIA